MSREHRESRESTAQASTPATPSLFPGKAWQQVLARDAAADGQFVYAVKTTKIFCRPSCPSRRPTRKNVAFFSTPALAMEAGYRPCLRCEPEKAEPRADPHAEAIAAAARHLDEHNDTVTSLTELGRVAGLNPFNLQRSFTRVLGVSPREYAKARKIERFKTEVRKTSGPVAKGDRTGAKAGRITDAIYEAGFSSSSRLYESAAPEMGMTPTEVRSRGKGLKVRYTVADSPLGKMLVASTDKGLCSVSFGESVNELEAELKEHFSQAVVVRDNSGLKPAVKAVLGELTEHPASLALPHDVRATAFQLRVWQALQAIPRGETRSYSEVAAAIGRPEATRAVARAIASNPLAVVVPCHRVIAKDGSLSGYRWGERRKRALLKSEDARG